MAFWNWLKSLFTPSPSSTPTPALPSPSVPQYPKGVELACLYLAKDPKDKFENPRYIAEIDYSKNSKEKRLAVYDRVANTVEFHKCAHGSGSGNTKHDGNCVEFSNSNGSHMTCLGAFETGDTYNGSNGLSLRLHGLDSTNDNAYERAIVMHGADYVNDQDSKVSGRSWGCPAVDRDVYKELIAKLKGGSLIYAHYNGHLKFTKDPRPALPEVIPSKPLPAPETSVRFSLFPVKAWEDHALKLVKVSKLTHLKPSDSWFKNTAEDWVKLLSAMCRYESNFKPGTKYEESFRNGKGEKVISAGLMQLSYESARGYGFTGITTQDLLDPFKNLEVAVTILERWVERDGVIAGPGNKGGGRYWSVLRSTGRLEDVKKQYAGLR